MSWLRLLNVVQAEGYLSIGGMEVYYSRYVANSPSGLSANYDMMAGRTESKTPLRRKKALPVNRVLIMVELVAGYHTAVLQKPLFYTQNNSFLPSVKAFDLRFPEFASKKQMHMLIDIKSVLRTFANLYVNPSANLLILVGFYINSVEKDYSYNWFPKINYSADDF